MRFVLVRVRERRRLWREQYIHLPTANFGEEATLKCPGQPTAGP